MNDPPPFPDITDYTLSESSSLTLCSSPVPTIRVCDRIEPEALESSDAFTSTADRYASLTGALPLLGWDALTRGSDGVLTMVRTLSSVAPWMGDVVDRIERQAELSLWIGRPWVRIRPLLLVGAPGTGKSHFARALAEASGCALAQIPMGGDSDNRSLAGTARGWTGAQPALPVVAMAQHRTANPIIVLDEIEKVSADRRHGNPHETLLAMLEPLTAKAWYDRCLMAAVDLRHVNWIATANTTAGIPAPLLSRFDVVCVRGPASRDAQALLWRLQCELARDWGVPVSVLPDLSPEAHDLLVEHFVRTGSGRALRRGLEVALTEALKTRARCTH